RGRERDFSSDVRFALSAIAIALGDKVLTPEAVRQIDERILHVVAEHHTKIEQRSRSPKGARPSRRATYTLHIAGPRIDERWHFSTAQFQSALRQAKAIELPQFK
ncbi:MAG: hypothetical protein ACRDL7_10195, partial [Gaiellaceae bacterium]